MARHPPCERRRRVGRHPIFKALGHSHGKPCFFAFAPLGFALNPRSVSRDIIHGFGSVAGGQASELVFKEGGGLEHGAAACLGFCFGQDYRYGLLIHPGAASTQANRSSPHVLTVTELHLDGEEIGYSAIFLAKYRGVDDMVPPHNGGHACKPP